MNNSISYSPNNSDIKASIPQKIKRSSTEQNQNASAAQAFSNLRRKSFNAQINSISGSGQLSHCESDGSAEYRLTNEPESYLQKQKLDLESIIEFFEKVPTKKEQLVHQPRYTFYSEKTGVIRSNYLHNLNIRLDDLDPRMVLGSGMFWIDVLNPTQLEMNQLSNLFGLHPLTSEDIQTEDTREKCEVFSNYSFIVIKSFEADEGKINYLSPISVFIVIFEECVLTVYK